MSTPTPASGAAGAQAAAQASMMALMAAQTDPAALDPYGPGDQTAREAMAPMFVTTIVFIGVNTLFLLLRFFTVLKLRTRRIALAWDDFFLVMAYPFVIGVCAIAILMWHYETSKGALANAPVVQIWRLTPLLKSTIALAEIGLPAMVLTRYSVLTLYLRLFTDRFVRVVSWGLIILYSMYWVAYALAGIFQCQPIAYYWERIDPSKQGHCWDLKFSRAVSPPNIAFDVIMILLPLHFIWTLRISTMRKLGLTTIIATGVLAFTITVIRTVILSGNTNELETPIKTNEFLLWFVLEPSLYFITACLPAMLPLFRLLLPSSMKRAAKRPIGALASTQRSNGLGAMTTNNSERGFLPLRDDTSQSGSQAWSGGRESKLSNLSVHEMDNNLQMEDMQKFARGEGIIVQTDISVTWTTEERIEEILDL